MNNLKHTGNIDDTIENLKSSPLFYLFLSSRELFHTNFWFWLSTLNRTETLKLFSDQNTGQDITFKREHNQKRDEFKSKVDLFITVGEGQNIAIENKVKDFPTAIQLQRIKNSFGESSAELILTTLFWSDDLNFEGWTVKTYRQLSNGLTPSLFTEDTYYQALISDYQRFTSNLATLAEQLEITQEYDFAISLNKGLYNKLNSIKLWEGYQKLRASHMLFQFKTCNEQNVNSTYSINNQKVTISFYVHINDSYKIGIQIEDIQYRKFITGPKFNEFSESLRLSNTFFDNTWVSPQKNTMLSYKPDFKYQYEKIDKMGFQVLFEKVKSDISYINENMQIIKSHLPKS